MKRTQCDPFWEKAKHFWWLNQTPDIRFLFNSVFQFSLQTRVRTSKTQSMAFVQTASQHQTAPRLFCFNNTVKPCAFKQSPWRQSQVLSGMEMKQLMIKRPVPPLSLVFFEFPTLWGTVKLTKRVIADLRKVKRSYSWLGEPEWVRIGQQ